MNPKKNPLAGLRLVMSALDDELRKKVCPACGKPTGGVVPDGMTPEQVGICRSFCPVCDGRGRLDGPQPEGPICTACRGTGHRSGA